MKTLMAITLILFGALWSYYATFNAKMMRTRAMSDAMQMEAELKAWAMDKVSGPQLLEIFPENYSLRFGGENHNRNFRIMIEDIAISSAPPVWPGVAATLIGLIGMFSTCRESRIKKLKRRFDKTPDKVLS